jgi:hypothetical protein
VGNLQTVPAVAASNGTSASITLANITSGTTYNDPIAFSPTGLGLNSGNYYLVNAATGAAVPQTVQSNGLHLRDALTSTPRRSRNGTWWRGRRPPARRRPAARSPRRAPPP